VECSNGSGGGSNKAAATLALCGVICDSLSTLSLQQSKGTTPQEGSACAAQCLAAGWSTAAVMLIEPVVVAPLLALT
jgi:hypothetical protein